MREERSLDYRDPEWLADQLGVDKTTIYRYLQDGLLPGLQLGRKWLVSERQVIAFLEEETRRQTEQRRRAQQARSEPYDRFTERAKQMLTHSQEEAVALGHNYVGTEHMLLGLLRDEASLGARVLAGLGVAPEAVRERILQVVGRGHPGSLGGSIGLTPRAKKALDLATEEARGLNHSYIGTEHVLLGMVREGDGIAARLLQEMGVTAERARAEVLRLLEGTERAEGE